MWVCFFFYVSEGTFLWELVFEGALSRAPPFQGSPQRKDTHVGLLRSTFRVTLDTAHLATAAGSCLTWLCLTLCIVRLRGVALQVQNLPMGSIWVCLLMRARQDLVGGRNSWRPLGGEGFELGVFEDFNGESDRLVLPCPRRIDLTWQLVVSPFWDPVLVMQEVITCSFWVPQGPVKICDLWFLPHGSPT